MIPPMLRRVSLRILLATFLLSTAFLVLEISLTRIFSVMTWYHSTPLVISIALLGSGTAGSWIAWRRSRGHDLPKMKQMAGYANAFAIASVVSVLIVTRIHSDPYLFRTGISPHAAAANIAGVIAWVVLLSCPFLLAGICLVSIVSTFHERIHRVYFADLVGAATGALISVPALIVLGATNMVVLVAIFAAMASIFLRWEARSRLLVRDLAVLTGMVILLFLGTYYQPFLVYSSPTKELWLYKTAVPGAKNDIEFSKWHPVARVDISQAYDSTPSPAGGNIDPQCSRQVVTQRCVFQDGAAPSWIFRLPGPPEETAFLDGYLQAAPYCLRPSSEALIIGTGGGLDILIALRHGVTKVTGVDINPWMIRSLTDTYNEFTNGLFRRPDIRLVVNEGRHFVVSDPYSYDIIQLSGVDTFSALNSGAYSLAEAHLYTVEAIHDLIARLKTDGILSYCRWLLFPPRETLRLAGLMRQALAEEGVTDPSQNIVIIRGTNWADTMVKRTPFTADEIARLITWGQKHGFNLLYNPLIDMQTPFDQMLRTDKSALSEFLAAYPYDVRPTTDDHPYFFDYFKWKYIFTAQKSLGGYFPTTVPSGLRGLLLGIVLVCLFALFGIILPVRNTRGALRAEGLSAISYFASLGFGFMFIEISLIQRLGIYVGGPTQALCFSLFVILLLSGCGSFLAQRFGNTGQRGFLLLGVALVAVVLIEIPVLNIVLPRTQTMGILSRFLWCGIIIAPMALLLGMPFPTGIRILGSVRPEWVPWAWAVNSFFTVLGPLICVLLSMTFGYRTVFLLAGLIYALGFLFFLPFLPAKGSAPS